jgi:hypothetical protein
MQQVDIDNSTIDTNESDDDTKTTAPVSQSTIIDLQLRQLVFVQSLEAGQELRHKGFKGSIILFSEKLSYLDLDGRYTQLFDYVMSLPPRQIDFKQIKQFILAKSESKLFVSST